MTSALERLRRLAPLLLLGLVVALIAGGLGYATADTSDARHATLPAAPTAVAGVRGIVQSVSGDSLTLSTAAGVQTVRLQSNATIEALRTVTLSTLQPGDWLNAGGVPNQQTLFALTGLVSLPQGSFQAPSK